MGFGRKIKEAKGIATSLATYYLDRKRHRAMDLLYSQFIEAGDLAFDVGAHVGDRTSSFLRLGAQVVAVEPQPNLATTLRMIFGRHRSVTLVEAAVSEVTGETTLLVNTANPTVSTASQSFIEAGRDVASWKGQHWDSEIPVPTTTLDALIADYGEPSFIKIDVEGLEDKVLAGLSSPVQALSFEFTTIEKQVAIQALRRLGTIGSYEFNAALGEFHRFEWSDWCSSTEVAEWLGQLPLHANSGDIYARRLS